MRSSLYGHEHEQFRKVAREFLVNEVQPRYPEWDAAGMVPRSFFNSLANLGVLGMPIPEEYGGAGCDSFAYAAVWAEEVARAFVNLGGLNVHLNVVLPYFLTNANAEQKQRWLPAMARGELLTAVAMTEPGTGSDLAGIATKAVRDGDAYVINGAKTFITGGINADLVVVVARTSREENRRDGLSLLVVERGMPGFERGKLIDKIGLKTQDTAELFFADVHVPAANLLGEEGRAFTYLTENLPQERLAVALGAVAAAEAAIEATVAYVKDRSAFGTPIASFQNTKFELAACSTDALAGRAMLERCIHALDAGELTAAEAAQVKIFCTEMQGRVVDRCLQLFGGYGYVREYPIARMYADARVTRIFGGTNEVLKTIVARSMGL